ncbi:glycosyltransferase family 4 protein [Advenella mimigardefordensis]|uniref:Putative glycosyltransferase n=1 Tax=Advenella mimigardefordensis (strain DSM 17166 / LMG 22922 / DPN7) TaxID=1247726 RepID=W0PCP5_ADVMD|nr:glycosyltransferase family 1 protein [Advenella mimigardefordensis]AHG62793.1 putative glycosyltransferase [Advenella mimigardefordensis DPN7]
MIGRIGVGATVLARGTRTGHIDGIGTYTQALCTQLASIKEIDVCTVSWQEPMTASITGEHLTLPKIRMEYDLAASALTGKSSFNSSEIEARFSLFHAADHFIPRLRKTPVIASLMDPIPLMYPEWVNQRARKLKNWLFRKEATWADHYITISHAVVDDLVKYFHLSRSNITVIPLGVDDIYFNRPSQDMTVATLEKYHLDPGFFLFIGTIQPRKNLKTLLDAFVMLPPEMQKRHPLIVAGRLGWGCEDEIRKLKQLEIQGVAKWLDYISLDDKRVLLSNARCLVFPSLYEGFGLPALEAFACALPVIGSNTTALAEVVDDAGLQVDPLNANALSGAMQTIASDESMAVELGEKGRARARTYTWKATAEKTVEVYRKYL